MTLLRPAAPLALALLACNAPSWDDFIAWHPDPGASSTGDSSTGADWSTGGDGIMTTTFDPASGGGTDSSSSTAVHDTTSTGSTGGPDTSTSSSSTGAPALCGDGVLDPAEECDDGNALDGDACDNLCLRNRRVFVTHDVLQPDEIQGLGGADSLCRLFALKGNLPNWKSFTAWLSDASTDASTRIHPGLGRYFRTDAVLVATGAAQFSSGSLDAPIERDEYGEKPVGTLVWTGTRPDGTAVPGSTHCAAWTSDNLLLKDAYFGHAGASDGRWTQHPDPELNPTICLDALHLYCIEGK